MENVYEKPLFGKIIKIIAYGDENLVGKIVEEGYEEGLRLQKIFNFFDSESGLSMLNKRRKLRVSSELLEVLINALNVAKESKGKYDITLGKAILARKKGDGEINVECSYKDVKIDGYLVELLNEDVMIDLGSIAKGYITDKMGEFMEALGLKEFLIDSRGDILVGGDYEHIIEIQHPRDKQGIIKKIKIRNEGVATSGDYNQFYGNYKKTHILNAKDIISLTVVAQTLEEADALATALFVSDEKEFNKIIKKNKHIKVLKMDNDMKVSMYNGFEEIVNE